MVSAPTSVVKSSSGLPWKQVGIAAGGLLLAGGILFGGRPKLSFENSASVAQVENFPEYIQTQESTLEESPNDTEAQLQLAENYREVGD